jgi:hypothetical protein
MTTKVVSQCERCYIKDNSKWEPESVGEDGSLVSKLIAVAMPVTLETGKIYVCADCGEITVVGIFVEMEEEDINFFPECLNADEGDEEHIDPDWEDS